MIVLPIVFNKLRLKIFTYFFKDIFHFVQNITRKNFTPVFCNKDQVNVNIKNTMSACSYFACIFHRPTVYIKT